jgi:hypothetical protein
MANYLFDQNIVKQQLLTFFNKEKATIYSFGSKVNQTFEAHVLATVIKQYKSNGWTVQIISPIEFGNPVFKLKFNTRGAPKGYSYVLCAKGSEACQIRHGLRVHTRSHKSKNLFSANVVCDIVVMKDIDIDSYTTNDALNNNELIAFGEVKHMSAFAELVANFIGLVHEIQPLKLKAIRKKTWIPGDHISPFLYVSGKLYQTANGIAETIKQRRYDIDIYSFDHPMN